MRKKTMLATAMALLVLMLAVSPAAAVTDGELDGNGHPYVGLMVAQTADGTPLWRCSGTSTREPTVSRPSSRVGTK